jgi:hypothetical protein
MTWVIGEGARLAWSTISSIAASVSSGSESIVAFPHAEDADFDAELRVEERVLRYAEPTEG